MASTLHRSLEMLCWSAIDCWSAYNGLHKYNNYQHFTVNHSEGFKNMETGETSNTIEGAWFHLKRSLPQAGTRKTMFPNYFAMYIWRKKYGTLDYGVFLDHVARVHNPTRIPQFIMGRTQDHPEYDPEDQPDDEEFNQVESEEAEPAARYLLRNEFHDELIDFDAIETDEERNDNLEELLEIHEEINNLEFPLMP